MARIYIDEEGKTSVYEILEEEIAVGRGAANQVQLRDSRASKHHALIRRVGSRWKFVDLESKNGTRVNGTYVNQRWLEHGDTITFGKAVLRFDAEGEGATGAAAAAAVAPAVPRVVTPPPPPSAPARPAAPVAPAAPMASAAPAAPVAPAASTPAAAPVRGAARAAAPAVRRTAPSRGGRGAAYDDYDDEEGRPEREYKKKGMDNSVLVLLGVLGVAAFIALMFVMMSSSKSTNKEVWDHAEALANKREYAAALAYAERHGEPGGEDWERLGEHIIKWRKIVQLEEQNAANEVAFAWLKENVERRTVTSGFTPKNALPRGEIAVLLRGFLTEYEGTAPANLIMSSRVGEPWETYRSILREHASADVDVGALLLTAQRKVDVLAGAGSFADALEVYERLQRTQRLMLEAEIYAELSRKLEQKKATLLRDTRTAFEADMEKVRVLDSKGNRRGARALLILMTRNYGLSDLVQRAEDRLEELR